MGDKIVMENTENKKDIGGRIFGVCFILFFLTIGTLIVVNGIEKKIANDKFMETAVTVQATCVKVSHGSRTYADFRYEYNGSNYSFNHVHVAKATKTGKTMTLYIDPNYPPFARSDDDFEEVGKQIVAGFLIGGIGIIAIALWVIGVIYDKRHPEGVTNIFQNIRQRENGQ